ncbi:MULTISPECIES: sodium-dependent bicarbonate transport family permease [unclassified Mycobacterium]|uniref:sodium-dependent bicarbonate transport family permease n=1 Tax=unclassified Mycobacterium TaxID=2642494 RepID=UPI0008008684|nr:MULTISPECIES: sodium-dependent bicarbonate transport family permease [unclassified Mycobacterium]OBG52613.1 sodium-dependent bicarbonate transport family permease [Mycobacterium sp. E735]OBG68992.1 sodium-dependent bicarbonate transport family permease [Mycobacterium sp. E188]OBG70723.1 sodium-dependent bicarbonate transport family permease [Mycobacterium sp. E3298]OBG82901.1 sodium-dependent bicarbonate transport family permease [Mycobacterium sp. E3305]OBH09668.1 sodium-dependent bicarbon
MLQEMWQNFIHNLFKPLLLFFYFGFLIPILRVRFEFPYVIYQGLTMYLLVAVGWQGGEELAKVKPADIDNIAGFVALGLVLNFVIGVLTYVLLRYLTRLRRVDRATVAGYYGSDSAGAFATCVAVLTSVKIAFDAYMPVLLAFMEIPGCLVALYLVARLRHRGMDEAGYMPDEQGYTAPARVGPGAAAQAEGVDDGVERGIEEELEFSLEKQEHAWYGNTPQREKAPLMSRAILQEVFLNPGLILLVGGIAIGFISALQGQKVVHDQNELFVAAFQGVLCLFLLEMGMTASRKLRDLKLAGGGFIAFGLLAPNLFAALGILAAYAYANLTDTHFQPGTYVLFAVLCSAASYITLPAVQRLGIPEASPTLPLAAALGLTFSYTVTIGIPLYIEINRAVAHWFPNS